MLLMNSKNCFSMNILLIIPETTGTIARVSHNLYLALKKRKDITLYVACLDASKEGFDFGNMYVWKRGKNIPCIGGIIKQYSRIKFLKKIKRELHIELSISTLLGCNTLNAMSSCGERTIGIFHAPLEQTKTLGWKSYISCWLSYKIQIRKLDKIYGVSKTIRKDLEKHCKKTADLLYNIHNFDNISSLSKEELNEEEHKLFNNNKIILYVGNLYSIKAPDRLINAFVKYKENTNSTTKLVFIGIAQFGYQKELNRVISNCGVEIINDIYFLGHKTNPYKYIAKSSILVSPSRSEGLPGVIIEALSLNIPVVATNSSEGVWEIMQSDANYKKELEDIYYTDFGVITPNLEDNETKNIDKLAQGIEYAINYNFNQISTFDKRRFNSQVIIEKIIND